MTTTSNLSFAWSDARDAKGNLESDRTSSRFSLASRTTALSDARDAKESLEKRVTARPPRFPSRHARRTEQKRDFS